MDQTGPGAGVEGGRSVVALVADLLFASRIRGAAEAAGVVAQTAGGASDLLRRVASASPDLVLLDLEARGLDVQALMTELRAVYAGPVVGFSSHTNAGVISAARRAGVGRVLARSAFVRELPRLLVGA